MRNPAHLRFTLQPPLALFGLICIFLRLFVGAASGQTKSIFDDTWAFPPAPPREAVAHHRPVPTAEEQQRSRKLLKQVYASELTKNTPAARRALSSRLLNDASTVADAPTDQFVLLAAAISAAKQGADLRACCTAADALGTAFDVDGQRVKVDAALSMPLRADDAAVTAENCRMGLTLVDGMTHSGDYPAAVKLLLALRPVAAVDPALASEVNARIKEIDTQRAESDRLAAAMEKLKTKPDDPAANLEIGRSLCFIRRDWASGLPHLTRGGDAPLEALASRDLAEPTSASEQAALGRDWWDAAEKRDPSARDAMRARASYWLATALPHLNGLERVAAEKYLAESPYLSAPVGQLVQQFTGHHGPVIQVAFTPDGKSALSSGEDSTVRQWDLLTGKELRRFEGHSDHVGRLNVAASGRSFVTGSLDHTVRLWDLDSGREVHRFDLDSECVSACISPDGRFCVCASYHGGPWVYSTTTFQQIDSFHGEGLYASAWCANNRLFATGGWDRITHVFSTATLKEVAHLPQDQQVYAIAFSLDSRLLLSSGVGHAVHLWDVQSGRELHRFDAGEVVRSVAFTPDNRFVLAAGGEREFVLWSSATGAVARRFTGQEAPLRSVAVSKDGHLALTGGDDGLIRLWRLPDAGQK